MNKSYRNVFNETTGTWVAVQETARAKGKRSTASVVAAGLVAAVVGGIALLPDDAQAGIRMGNNGGLGSHPTTDNSTSMAMQSSSAAAGATKATGQNSMAFGNEALASEGRSIAIGTKTVSSGSAATALGANAQATAADAIAIGGAADEAAAKSEGLASVAIGWKSRVNGAGSKHSVALGSGAAVTGASTIAIGSNAQSTTTVEGSANVANREAIAIGNAASANAYNWVSGEGYVLGGGPLHWVLAQ